MEATTSRLFTETADGNIPHLFDKRLKLAMPAVLTKRKNSNNRHYVKRTPRDFIVYALPGGGETTLDPKGLK